MKTHKDAGTESPRSLIEVLKYGNAAKITLAVILVIVIAMLFPKGLESRYDYREGDIWVEEERCAYY